jgi:hypothetical protein
MEKAWRAGQDLDLATMIEQVQTPPVTKIGVLNVEAFYPPKERFELVMALNNLLASPGFSSWLEGEALDITNILYTTQGKPRIAIFSIAHLNDAERMFFVSLLLNQIIAWMRTQYRHLVHWQVTGGARQAAPAGRTRRSGSNFQGKLQPRKNGQDDFRPAKPYVPDE